MEMFRLCSTTFFEEFFVRHWQKMVKPLKINEKRIRLTRFEREDNFAFNPIRSVNQLLLTSITDQQCRMSFNRPWTISIYCRITLINVAGFSLIFTTVLNPSPPHHPIHHCFVPLPTPPSYSLLFCTFPHPTILFTTVLHPSPPHHPIRHCFVPLPTPPPYSPLFYTSPTTPPSFFDRSVSRG